jgi:hypothetical protein
MKILALILLTGCAGAQAAVTASPNDSIVMAPSAALLTDAAGNTWGISSAACKAPFAAGTASMVTLNGTADATTCGVTELAYVGGIVWQFNGTDWYSKASATAAWSAGTTVSPLPAMPTYLAQATLTWIAPTLNTNGTPITAPLTYNVYRGSSATTLTKLTNVSALTYVDPAGSATPTMYYYAVTAICAGCTESADSGVVSDTIAAATLTPGAPSGLAVH